jgi:hypothetical protein
MSKSLDKKVVRVKKFSQMDEIEDETWIRLKNGIFGLKVNLYSIDKEMCSAPFQVIRYNKRENTIEGISLYGDSCISKLYDEDTFEYDECKEILDRNKLE